PERCRSGASTIRNSPRLYGPKSRGCSLDKSMIHCTCFGLYEMGGNFTRSCSFCPNSTNSYSMATLQSVQLVVFFLGNVQPSVFNPRLKKQRLRIPGHHPGTTFVVAYKLHFRLRR